MGWITYPPNEKGRKPFWRGVPTGDFLRGRVSQKVSRIKPRKKGGGGSLLLKDGSFKPLAAREGKIAEKRERKKRCIHLPYPKEEGRPLLLREINAKPERGGIFIFQGGRSQSFRKKKEEKERRM